MLKYDPKDSQFPLLAEGQYTFKIIDEPEKRRGSGGGVYYIFKFKAQAPDGSLHDFRDTFPPWDERFGILLTLCGGEEDEGGAVHISETEVKGKYFKASIIHEPSRKEPSKMLAKISFKIGAPKSEAKEEDEEDIPPPKGKKKNRKEEDEAPF